MTGTGLVAEGDVVTVLAVPSSLVRDLPGDERAFLLSLVGETATVSETSPGEWVEIEAYDRKSGMTHFLRLAEVDVGGEQLLQVGRARLPDCRQAVT